MIMRVTSLEALICIIICENRAFKQKPQNILIIVEHILFRAREHLFASFKKIRNR
jgi:hypothetical protein